jgi:molybdenum cofactor cytidylyltransferase
VLTELPGVKESAMEGAVEVTQARIEALMGTLLPVERVPHETAATAAALDRLRRAGAEMLLIAGASAVVDRQDVGPGAIVRAGGRIEHFGMPVDPGNLLCLGELDGRPALVPARLRPLAQAERLRLGAAPPLRRRARPRARRDGDGRGRPPEGDRDAPPAARQGGPAAAARPSAARAPRAVAGLVLAAGRSRRMAPRNKLLVPDADGTPMVARVVDQVLASGVRPVLVVTGHERERLMEALAGRPVQFVHAEDYAEGLSASLKAGVAAVPPEAEGVLIALGDMPLVSAGGHAPPARRLRPGGRARHRPAHLSRQAGQPGAVGARIPAGHAVHHRRCRRAAPGRAAPWIGWWRWRCPRTASCATSTPPPRWKRRRNSAPPVLSA